MRAAGSEIGGDLVTAAKVHLVRRLAREGCVRDDGIVLFDVEGDQVMRVWEHDLERDFDGTIQEILLFARPAKAT